MEIGFVGLGRMGGNMVKALLKDGHDVVVFDLSKDAVEVSVKDGARGVASLADLVGQLKPPRRVWVMVPCGSPTDDSLRELAKHCDEGDLLIDGGNSNFHDSKEMATQLAQQGIGFVDAGVSGGLWGLEFGYCTMVGGSKEDVDAIAPVLDTLAPKDGWAHMGPVGSGHYVKMVHNGVEYGMLQAYGEGFEIMKNSEYDLDLKAIADLWNHASVVRSWLLELAANALSEDDFEHIRPYVDDSGEGRWTVQEAIDVNVPAPVLTISLLERIASRQDESFSAKMIAAIRNQFGGHEIHEE